jgi:hypothetical protein
VTVAGEGNAAAMSRGEGVARGVAGAVAMSLMRAVTTRLGLVGRTPPDAIAFERAPRLLARLPQWTRRPAIELGHLTYGGAIGAAYVGLPARFRTLQWSGPAYGLATWVLYEGVVAPALGLSHAGRHRPVERLALAADHVLYGLVLARR